MTKSLNIKSFLFFILLFSLVQLYSQEVKNWEAVSSPLFSNFKKIQFISSDSAFISGKQLLLLKDGKCKKFPFQPPFEISAMHAINSNCIYVSNNTPYQNSDLYLWNGKQWKSVFNPMANNIKDQFFTDSKNGLLVSYGEIAQMINGKWSSITPPTNRAILQVLQTSEKEIVILVAGKGIYLKKAEKWIFIKHSKNTFSISKIGNRIYTTGYKTLGVIQSDSLKIESKDPVWSRITSLTKTEEENIIGVGLQGKMVQFSKVGLHEIVSGTKQNLKQIINHNNQLWCVGNEGTLLKYSEKKIKDKSAIWKGFETITFNKQAKMIDDEYGVIAADFNNDGLTDIFTCGLFEKEHLYINKGDFVFLEQAEAFHIGSNEETKTPELNLGACAGDIDNDGYIDIYLGVLNGKNRIYKNIDGKFFVDYSNTSKGIGDATDRTNACIMGDVDNDGDLDIFIANEYSTNRLFLNNGVGIFKEVTNEVHLKTTEGGNSATFGDIDQDGDIDLYVTNWSSQNVLYQNQFIETGKLSFKKITKESKTGGKSYTKSNAAVFSDLDNDGDLDLFVSNRKTSNKLYLNNGKGVFKDATKSLLGIDSLSSYGAVIADFDGDSFKDIYLANVGENVFYKNIKGKFVPQTTKYGASIKGYSTGAALSDFNNDGALDIYVANYLGASSTLLRNKKSDKQHITVQITGFQNTRNAIGTKLFVYNKNSKLIGFDEIRAGSGYVSVNDFKKVFPIQNKDTVHLKVIFPNGIIKNKSAITQGNTVYISDVEGFKKYSIRAKYFLKKCLYDPHNLFEFLKWIFVIFLISFTGFIFQKKHHWKVLNTVLGGFLFLIFYYIQYRYLEYSPFMYATVLPITSIIVTVLLTYYFFEKRYIKRKSEQEKTKIKTKLSRDLHDDLATTVSSIGFYLTMIKFNLKGNNPKISEFIHKSERLLQEATNSLTDLIWAINPKSETLNTLLFRIKKNYQTLFKERNIVLTFPQENRFLETKLNDVSKQNIYLICKEALNNILKYADATKVSIQIKKTSKAWVLSIGDNGNGFEYKSVKNKGNGLLNMQKRAEELRAKMHIISNKGEGTLIKIVFS